ncbi:uncharacterized protein LOC115219150 [Octopus sinensis]|uniref:Uncharacterized protein LOC115219150 n=1 Tax=Octopus sinensis TaxID=2607531 RepID=A0A6P7T4E3_9MOLL|nr:uncharacterized protein LOC115219150 [Octopus sinensis]
MTTPLSMYTKEEQRAVFRFLRKMGVRSTVQDTAIRTKRGTLLLKKLLLLHDDAHPHTAAHTVETINQLGLEVLEHPAYSPDLVPSDYHISGSLKDGLRGIRQFKHIFIKFG